MSAPGARIGVDAIGVWPGTVAVDIGAICRARGMDADNFVRRLHCEQRSLVGPFEDVVTMAVNAAEIALDEDDRERIQLLVVATESAVDDEKPLSTWVHHHLGLRSDCRNFEVKHACYGATAALRTGLAWLRSGELGPEAKVLVINTDHSLIGLEGVQEPILGAGAAAIVLSHEPRMASIEPRAAGVYAHEIADIFRPARGLETGDAADSLLSYLEGAERTWEDLIAKRPELHFDRDFAAHVYHVPFGGLAERAHVRLCERVLGLSRRQALEHFHRKVAPSLVYSRRMGGVYGAATFVALLGLLATSPVTNAGDRVRMYAYGSGSCAETYVVRLEDEARARAERAGLAALLDERRMVDLSTYEACERALDASLRARDVTPTRELVPGLYESHYERRGRLVLRNVKEWRREYARS